MRCRGKWMTRVTAVKYRTSCDSVLTRPQQKHQAVATRYSTSYSIATGHCATSDDHHRKERYCAVRTLQVLLTERESRTQVLCTPSRAVQARALLAGHIDRMCCLFTSIRRGFLNWLALGNGQIKEGEAATCRCAERARQTTRRLFDRRTQWTTLCAAERPKVRTSVLSTEIKN